MGVFFALLKAMKEGRMCKVNPLLSRKNQLNRSTAMAQTTHYFFSCYNDPKINKTTHIRENNKLYKNFQ